MARSKRKTGTAQSRKSPQAKRTKGAERLQFMHSGKPAGFRLSGISAYNNVDPHTVVRELVQNSLDAALKAERDVIRVAFEIEEVEAASIPARADYEEHLRCAIDTQRKKGNLGQAAMIVSTMQATLAADRVTVLWVLDNGIGLDAVGMESLLGDGQSGKADESAAGSYGNGHMTSFPASDLRYVVYGGVHGTGRTASGHAILASHAYRKKMYGEDGYIARTIRPDDLFSPFDFYSGSGTPLLKDKLDRIEERYGTGSAVGILGFNRFNRYENDDDVLGIIETVVATHFMPLIRDGTMEVVVSACGAARTIDSGTLETILARRQGRERRDRNSIGPSGRQAWETLETLKPKHGRTIRTKAGTVRFHCRELGESGGGTHLQLFRNGMWISNEVRYNVASDYREVMSFNGVVLLEPDGAKEACGLVRSFEGPRHIDIDLTRHQRGTPERTALEEFLKELRDGVLAQATPLSAKEHDPGFFSIEVTGDGVRRNPRARAGGTGTPEQVPHREPTRTQTGERRGPKRRGGMRRQGRRIDARVTAVRKTRGMRLRARPLEDAANAELRVVIANGSDETCDSPEPEQFLEIGKGAKMGGKRVKGYVRDEKGRRLAVMLGPVSANGEELDVWLPCRPAEDGVVRVELVRRAATRSKA